VYFVKQIRKRLTYANVMSSIAVFLILGGATAFAARKIGSHQLKSNSVTTAKIKRNAVSTAKIKKNAVSTAKIRGSAVTNAKLGEGSVTFNKIATGTTVIATATGTIAATQGSAPETPADIPLSGTTSFTPQAGVLNLLNIEVKGNNLAPTGVNACTPAVVPFVNDNAFEVAQGVLTVRAFPPTKEEPTGLQPVTGETAPLGLTSPGVNQTIALKLFGDTDCPANASVSVAIAVTQSK
jgi:hypothetical protein